MIAGLAVLVPLLLDEPIFDPLPCPWRFAQKRQAGLYARVDLEAADRDSISHLCPAMLCEQLLEKVLQSDPMQWIAGMIGRKWHEHYFVPAAVMTNSSDAKSFAISRAMDRGERAPIRRLAGKSGARVWAFLSSAS